jgi:esterase/lipase/1-acyl-sn-glycerol-3-phosphate acyltransferase
LSTPRGYFLRRPRTNHRVIPAKAGIQCFLDMDPGLRRGDEGNQEGQANFWPLASGYADFYNKNQEQAHLTSSESPFIVKKNDSELPTLSGSHAMNRRAYLTTGLAIKTISNLSKADIHVHGQENIPTGPIIFVVNHFTRIETLILPCYIYNQTAKPVGSLAAAELFKGSLQRFFDLVGVISTKDPQRDQLILSGLLSGGMDWIIYPEGNMVKTKKIFDKGEFMVSSTHGEHRPHTGAASLALRTELLRRNLLGKAQTSPIETRRLLERLSIGSIEALQGKSSFIVPVNLTYYPIRARENIASTLAAKLIKDPSERMMEEIMTEGTMLLSGVDLDIRFGKSIRVDSYLKGPEMQRETPLPEGLETPPELEDFLRRQSTAIMERYMEDIYSMTTVNHEHLFASFLRLYPRKKMRESDLKRRVFLAATRLGPKAECNLHRSLRKDQVHLLIDDRFGKYRNFIDLATEKKVIRKEKNLLVKDGRELSDLISFHRGRIDNPVEIIANEVEPLEEMQRLLHTLSWQPDFLIKTSVVDYLLRQELARFRQDFFSSSLRDKSLLKTCSPFLLHGSTRRIGVVLVHSYLAHPEQVRLLAEYLSAKGIWVYAPRLIGHGTTPEDLAERTYEEWLQSVEVGYAIISNICEKVVVGGMAVGGLLAFDLAARVKRLSGVFAVCPPYSLRDFSTRFMPGIDVWNRILTKIKGNTLEDRFLELSADPSSMSYTRNPVVGVTEVGRLLHALTRKLDKIRYPALILQSSDNPVVDKQGSRQFFDKLGSKKKYYCQVESAQHIIINGDGADSVHMMIEQFIRGL